MVLEQHDGNIKKIVTKVVFFLLPPPNKQEERNELKRPLPKQ